MDGCRSAAELGVHACSQHPFVLVQVRKQALSFVAHFLQWQVRPPFQLIHLALAMAGERAGAPDSCIQQSVEGFRPAVAQDL
jgi:hypothetical protein